MREREQAKRENGREKVSEAKENGRVEKKETEKKCLHASKLLFSVSNAFFMRVRAVSITDLKELRQRC